MIDRVRVLTGLLSALTFCVAVTAGCASGDETGRITLGYGSFPGWLPWKVAEVQGLFEKNGVDVELRYFDNITDGNNAMSSGALDANNQTLNDTLSALSGGARPQKIVTIGDTSTGADQIISNAAITSVAGLKGKKVAVEEGIVDHYFLLLALEEANLGLDDIDVELMSTSAATAAFVGGQVDAVVNYAPYTSTALAKKDSHAIATSADFPNALSDHLVVSGELARDRPDDVQALVDTWFDALTWVERNADEANAIMAQQAGIPPAEFQSYASGLTMFTLRQNIDAFTPGTTSSHLEFQANDIADFLVETGLARDRPTVDGLLDNRFVTAAAL